MRRKFQLVDLMVLVLLFAGLFTWYRTVLKYGTWDLWYDLSLHAKNAVVLAYLIPALLVGSLALSWFWLQQPRPRWRKRISYPGFAATLLTSLMFLAQIVFFALSELLSLLPIDHRELEVRPHTTHWDLRWFLGSLSVFADTGLLVLGGWVLLRLAGLWHAQAIWSDRLGRLLGAGWIIVWLISYLSDLGIK